MCGASSAALQMRMNTPARRTGLAHLPLHGGHAPAWLFDRMARLAREITEAIIIDFGPEEMLRRLADPFWFQAFGCVLGYDWHSSGVTTTVCGALKAGLAGSERDLGLFVAGGKGRAALATPRDIRAKAGSLSIEPETLVYASRMSAKVDNVALQDGYDLYHHSMFFTADGRWTVVQQGMNTVSKYARRYHWLGEAVTDFCCEPEAAICSDTRGSALNLVAKESEPARKAMVAMSRDFAQGALTQELHKINTLTMPRREYLTLDDISIARLGRLLDSVQEHQPQGFEDLIGLRGVGAKTARAMALIADIVYGAPTSFRDPATYSFAHGGKDGHPFPVDRALYDVSIKMLADAVRHARMGDNDRREALSRLNTAVTD